MLDDPSRGLVASNASETQSPRDDLVIEHDMDFVRSGDQVIVMIKGARKGSQRRSCDKLKPILERYANT